MNIIWRTNHPIADTVADSLAKGIPNVRLHSTSELDDRIISNARCHLAYGILRGTADIFASATRLSRPYFNVDRGYFGAGHFEGYYRISCNGTQAIYDETLNFERRTFPSLKPWHSDGAYILICPPTKHVCEFFGIDQVKWLEDAKSKCETYYVARYKDDPTPLSLHNVKRVITFNSSVGWLALAEGIPVDSDPQHSTVGSYCYKKSIDNIDRNELLSFMWSHQFTLTQIE